jgi:hypothetical protein
MDGRETPTYRHFPQHKEEKGLTSSAGYEKLVVDEKLEQRTKTP